MSDPFKHYRSVVREMKTLHQKREKAQLEAEASEQLLTLSSILKDTPQMTSLKHSASYCRKVINEIVSSYPHF